MKNILFTSFSGAPSPDIGGSNRIIHQLIKGLDQKKYNKSYLSYDSYRSDISFLSTKPYLSTKKKITRLLYNNIQIYRKYFAGISYQRIHFKKRKKYFTKFIKEKSYEFDIIHSHHPLSAYYFSNSSAKKILSIHAKQSAVYELQVNEPAIAANQNLLNELREMEIAAFNNADVITFPSIAGKNMFLDYYGERLRKDKDIRIIYNGVDLEFISNIEKDFTIFDKYGIPLNKHLKIFNVANHVEQKNISTLIQSVNFLVNKYFLDIVFINVGIGPLTDSIKALITEYNLKSSIFLLDKMPNYDIIKFMKVCDIFLMASKDVVFDLVILEALASRLYTVVSNNGGNKEIINSSNGFLINKNNACSIADAIMKIIQEKKHINKSKTELHYISINRMVEEYQGLYDSRS